MSASASSTGTRIGWELHGLRVDLRSSSTEVASYLRAHLGAGATEPHRRPDLLIDMDWTWGALPPRGGGPEGQRLGRYLREEGGRVRWSRVTGFEGLVMEAGWDPDAGAGTVAVRAASGYVPRDPLARIRYLQPARRDKKTHRTLFKMLYYALYFPLAWHLECSRGWEILHASAVEKDGKALLLAGHGGAGKSTLALSMMADPAVRFISDNLVLHDGASIHALPEPVRLDGSSLEAIRGRGYEPAVTGLPRSAHPKQTFQVEPRRISWSAPVQAVALLRFTSESFVRSLDPPEAAAHLVAARDLVKEVEAYRPVAAFLSMATGGGPGMARPPAPPATALDLARRSSCYLVGIGRGEPVARTLERLGEIFP